MIGEEPSSDKRARALADRPAGPTDGALDTARAARAASGRKGLGPPAAWGDDREALPQTSALSIRETNKVLGYVEKARSDLGRPVVFITHIMRHIHPIADRFVVLWQGRKVAEVDRGKLTIRGLEELVIRGPLETLADAPG